MTNTFYWPYDTVSIRALSETDTHAKAVTLPETHGDSANLDYADCCAQTMFGGESHFAIVVYQ